MKCNRIKRNKTIIVMVMGVYSVACWCSLLVIATILR